MPLRTCLRGLRAAGVFLTRVPLGGFPYSEAELRWASGWFPAVGLAHGAACGLVYLALAPAGPWPAAAAALAVGMLLTGAFHEDGLADTADALGGAYDRARVLEILKDSRVGSFGAAALAITLLLRASCLARLGPGAPLALALVGAASRVPPIWLMRALPYVTADAAARSRLVARAGALQTLLATLTAALALLLSMTLGTWSLAQVLAVSFTMAAAAALCGWRFRVRLGGITGDFLGATQQVAEVLALLALAWLQG